MRPSHPQPTPVPIRRPAPVVRLGAGSSGADASGVGEFESAGRSWGGPILVLVAVLTLLWAVPIAVDMVTIGGSVGERVLLFLVVTAALGCCFPIGVAIRRRRLRRR